MFNTNKILYACDIVTIGGTWKSCLILITSLFFGRSCNLEFTSKFFSMYKNFLFYFVFDNCYKKLSRAKWCQEVNLVNNHFFKLTNVYYNGAGVMSLNFFN